jgi:hypothetical protein
MKLYMFRTVRLSIISSLFTVHSAVVYVIQVCRQLSNRTRMVLLESFMTKYICEISASSWFYYKEICYDARSHELKMGKSWKVR